MIKADKKQQTARHFASTVSLKAIAKGVFTSYIFLMPAFLCLAIVYTYTSMPDKFLSPATDVLSMLSIFLAGFASSAKAGNHGWLHGLLAGVLYALVRIVMGLAIFGRYVPSKGIASTILITALLSALGGIVGVNVLKKPRKN